MNTPPQILGLPQRGKGTQIAKGLVRQDIRVGLMLAAYKSMPSRWVTEILQDPPKLWPQARLHHSHETEPQVL